MISIHHILVPTDFSEPSEVAVKYGRAFAESFQATLHLLHVVEDFTLTWPSNEGAAMLSGPMLEELERGAQTRLEKILSDADLEKFHAKLVIVRGSASLEITAYAQSEKIDLIILGTHGRNPIAHMLMGSVAEKVVRKAPCPVLTVRHPEHEFVTP